MEKNLTELEILEESKKVENQNEVIESVIVKEEVKTEAPNSLNGYVKINNYDLPQEGKLYPESWSFAYRCPTAKEIANFSTLNDNDQPAILAAVEDLIKLCVIIFDIDLNTKIPTGEICDAHRIYFLLLLRDLYLPGNPVKTKSICQTCHETFDTILNVSKLEYPELNDKLIDAYDGRKFKLDIDDKQVTFRIPTLETTGKLFKYIVKTYRSASNNKDKKEDNIIFDKQFLLLGPYLFETGKERIQDIVYKFKQIVKDDSLFRVYLTIINKLKLDNNETFYNDCTKCGSEEEAEIKFPGGYKKFFVSTSDSSGYFD